MLSPSPAMFDLPETRDALRIEAERYVGRATLMIDRARALVLSERVQAIDLLTAQRGALGDHFGRYQRFKHSAIFDPVVEHGPTSSKLVARTMKVDCMALGERFAAYQARCLGLGASDWTYYRRDMLATTEALTVNLRAELRAIRQLLTISGFYADFATDARA